MHIPECQSNVLVSMDENPSLLLILLKLNVRKVFCKCVSLMHKSPRVTLSRKPAAMAEKKTAQHGAEASKEAGHHPQGASCTRWLFLKVNAE